MKDIYLDDHSLMEPIKLISRAIFYNEFSRFLEKLPDLLRRYHKRNMAMLSELTSKIQLRVNTLYWQAYTRFREAFGLKLNYSLKIEKGIDEVRLIKRVERKSFKVARGEG